MDKISDMEIHNATIKNNHVSSCRQCGATNMTSAWAAQLQIMKMKKRRKTFIKHWDTLRLLPYTLIKKSPRSPRSADSFNFSRIIICSMHNSSDKALYPIKNLTFAKICVQEKVTKSINFLRALSSESKWVAPLPHPLSDMSPAPASLHTAKEG